MDSDIKYKTNISGSKPRDLYVTLMDAKGNPSEEFDTMSPEYNSEKDIYQLDFYGRAKVASARNFQLMNVKDKLKINLALMHGKV